MTFKREESFLVVDRGLYSRMFTWVFTNATRFPEEGEGGDRDLYLLLGGRRESDCAKKGIKANYP